MIKFINAVLLPLLIFQGAATSVTLAQETLPAAPEKRATPAPIRRVDYGNIESHAQLKPAANDDITTLAFNSTSKLLAGGGRRNIDLWDITTGERVATLSGHTSWVTKVAFSPDDTLLASGSADRTIKLWDTEAMSLVATIEAHDGIVTFLMFMPDGRHLLSAGTDQTIKIWDLATRRVVRRFTGLWYPVYAARVSADRARLTTIGGRFPSMPHVDPKHPATRHEQLERNPMEIASRPADRSASQVELIEWDLTGAEAHSTAVQRLLIPGATLPAQLATQSDLVVFAGIHPATGATPSTDTTPVGTSGDALTPQLTGANPGGDTGPGANASGFPKPRLPGLGPLGGTFPGDYIPEGGIPGTYFPGPEDPEFEIRNPHSARLYYPGGNAPGLDFPRPGMPEEAELSRSGVISFDLTKQEYLPHHHSRSSIDKILALAFVPDESRIAIMTSSYIEIWDGAPLTLKDPIYRPYSSYSSYSLRRHHNTRDPNGLRLSGQQGNGRNTLTFSPNGQYLAVTTSNRQVQVYFIPIDLIKPYKPRKIPPK